MAYYYQQSFMGQPQQYPHQQQQQHFVGLQQRQYHQQPQHQYQQPSQQHQRQVQPPQPPQLQQYDDHHHVRVHPETNAPVQTYNSLKSPLVIRSRDLPVRSRQDNGQPPYPARQKVAVPVLPDERRGRHGLRGVVSANDLIPAMPNARHPIKAVAVQVARRAFEPRAPKFTIGFMPPELKRLMPPEATVVKFESKHPTGHPNLQLITKVNGNGDMTCGVFKVKNKTSGQLMVLKRVAMGTRRSKAEVFALWQLRKATVHPNINFIIDYFIDDRLDCYSLLLNDCDRGTLEDMMETYGSKGRKTPEILLYHIFLSLSRALSFIHFGIVDPVRSEVPITDPWNSICHLDIKPSNVFVKSNDGRGTKLPRIVLGDFGCAVSDWDVTTETENPFAQSHGTPGWFPPENVGSLTYKTPGTEICYGLPTDIWQTGGLVQVMCQNWKKPDQATADGVFPCGRGVDAELQRAVKACMDSDFRKRPGASQIVVKLNDVMRLKGYETWH